MQRSFLESSSLGEASLINKGKLNSLSYIRVLQPPAFLLIGRMTSICHMSINAGALENAYAQEDVKEEG